MLLTIALVSITLLCISALVAITWHYYGVGTPKHLVDTQADVPVPFGDDVSWLAVPTEDISTFTKALAAADDRLSHSTFRPANWESGLARARADFGEHEIFVTPPVDGWIFAAHWEPPVEHGEKLGTVLDALSREFGRATAFQKSDHETMWALSENGRLRRGVVAAPDSWQAVGSPTVAERRLGITSRGPVTNRRLRALAEAWSKDPSRLDQHSAPGLGRIGSFDSVETANVSQAA